MNENLLSKGDNSYDLVNCELFTNVFDFVPKNSYKVTNAFSLAETTFSPIHPIIYLSFLPSFLSSFYQ